MTEEEKKAEDAARAKAATVAETDAAIEEEAPTPTQAELDAVKLGEHHLDAAKGGAYKTRQAKAN